MMGYLDQLEHKSVHIFREAYANFKSLCMLWSIGKDSTVLLWLARKAFFGHVPFPLVHIDTSFKIPEMIAYRDRLACCGLLKTEALKKTLSGEWRRHRFNPDTRTYDIDPDREPFTGVIAGI